MEVEKVETILKKKRNGSFFSIQWEKPIELENGEVCIKQTSQVVRKVRNIGGYESKGKGFSWATKIADYIYRHNSKGTTYICIPIARHSKITHNTEYSISGEKVAFTEVAKMAKRKSDLPRKSDKEQLFVLIPTDQIKSIK